VPAILLHGRQDTSIPITETLRLAAALPPTVPRTVTITRLVGHAKMRGAGPPRNPAALAGEVWRLVRTMRRIVSSVR
jgi:hypothetical protein